MKQVIYKARDTTGLTFMKKPSNVTLCTIKGAFSSLELIFKHEKNNCFRKVSSE